MQLNEINNVEMGLRIRKRGEILGMSRTHLAEKLCVTAKYIADIEYGSKGISVKNLYLLKQVLGVSTDYILGDNCMKHSDNEVREALTENILGSLSVCSTKQLSRIEQIIRLYVDSIVDS